MLGEYDGALQAGDLLLVDSVDIGEYGILPGRLKAVSCWQAKVVVVTHHLLGDVDFLEDGHGALLERAFNVNLQVSTASSEGCDYTN